MKSKKFLMVLTLCFVMILSCGLLSACGNNEEQFTPYTIVFHTNGGNAVEDLYVDNADTMIPTTTKGQYPFKGWYLDNETFAKEYTIKTNVTPDTDGKVHVYAKWSEYVIKTVYYESEYEIGKEYETFEESIYLYQPNVVGKYFLGWYKEETFNNKVDDLLTNEMVTSTNNYIILYAKYEDKEVDKLEIIGNIKTEYEYGEPFDANGAKLKVTYMDKGQPADIIDITTDMLENFFTEDRFVNGSGPYSTILISNKTPNFYDGIFKIKFNSARVDIDYKVNTDLENLQLNDVISFTHGDNYRPNKISITYKKFGEESTTEIVENTTSKQNDDDSWSLGIKCFDLYIHDDNYGTLTGRLRFHFKTIEFNYTVLPNENIVSGKIEVMLPLNYEGSLVGEKGGCSLYDSIKEDYIHWNNLTEEQVLVDIDTSTSGTKTARVLYNGKEIEIEYYVIDYNEIVSAKIVDKVYCSNVAGGLLSPYPPIVFQYNVEFTLSDEKTFEETIGTIITLDNTYLESLDVQSTGTKTGKVHYKGKIIDLEYTVEYYSSNNTVVKDYSSENLQYNETLKQWETHHKA